MVTLVVLEPQTCDILMMEGNWGVLNSITLVSDKATDRGCFFSKGLVLFQKYFIEHVA